jgi:hypothetical protein
MKLMKMIDIFMMSSYTILFVKVGFAENKYEEENENHSHFDGINRAQLS